VRSAQGCVQHVPKGDDKASIGGIWGFELHSDTIRANFQDVAVSFNRVAESGGDKNKSIVDFSLTFSGILFTAPGERPVATTGEGSGRFRGFIDPSILCGLGGVGFSHGTGVMHGDSVKYLIPEFDLDPSSA